MTPGDNGPQGYPPALLDGSIPGDAWKAFVLAEMLPTVREYRSQDAELARGSRVEPTDEVTAVRRRRILCEALDTPLVRDVTAAG